MGRVAGRRTLFFEFIIKDMTGSSLTQSLVRSGLHHIHTFSLRTRAPRYVL